MQPVLHGELEHDAGEHHRGFLAGGAVGEGPGAEQGQGFADVIDLRDLAEGGPDHFLERVLEFDEQGGLGDVVAGGDGDDGPVEEGVEVVVLMVGEFWIEEGEEGVVGGEVDLVELGELVVGEGHMTQGGRGGAGGDGRVAHGGEFTVALAEVQQTATGRRLVGAEEGLLARHARVSGRGGILVARETHAQRLELRQTRLALIQLLHHLLVLRPLPEPLEVIIDAAVQLVLDTPIARLVVVPCDTPPSAPQHIPARRK